MAVLFKYRFFALSLILPIFFVVQSVSAQVEPVVVSEDVSVESSPDVSDLDTSSADQGVIFDDSNDTAEVISGPSVSAVLDEAEASGNESSFFDADDLMPQGEMAKSGPKKIDPVARPASRFVTVQQNAKVDSREAQIVSAERAMDLGRFDAALHLFDILYEENKRDARVVMGRAVALQKLERFDEAMGMYEVLEGLDPKNVDIKVNMLGLLGTRYPSIALRRLLQLYETNKSHVGLTAQLAIAYANTGDAQSALRYLGAASAIDPQNASHLYNMAIITDRAGHKKEAVKYYEQALELDTIYGGGRTIPREAVYERLAHIR